MKKFAVGESDFKDIISGSYYYVDKSLFIKEILDRSEKVILIPRPRRFGKTLNITMLKYFYDCCPATGSTVSPSPAPAGDTGAPDRGNRELFASLAISKAGPQYLDKMGKHPVIFLTFKNIKESDWETIYRKIKKLIRQEYARHHCLLESSKLMPFEKDYYQKIIDLGGEREDYENSLDLLWSFLLMGGYLKQTAKRRDPASGKIFYKLSIPNEEVKITYTGIIDRYFSNKIENEQLEIMLKALVEGDIVLFEEMLQKVVAVVFSYHDFSGEPEKVYHALVAGLLVWISNTHEIKSNRESGYGRYDIMIIPSDISQWGYVIEFKKTRKDETVDTAVKSALKQIEEKKYESELVQRGVKNYKKLAVVFNGKDVTVKEG